MEELLIGRVLLSGEPTLVVKRAGRVARLSVDLPGLMADWVGWRSRLEARNLDEFDVDLESLVFLAPAEPANLICVGTNYSDHVAEMAASGGPAAKRSPWPFCFFKPPRTALVGHDSEVPRPRYSRRLDWEVELAVIIGDPTQLSGSNPLGAIFGYSILNDLSVRDFIPLPHSLGMDAVVMKGFDGSAPMGPWIRPADEVTDPQNLKLKLRVNGVLKQDGQTANMIFSVSEILKHLGQVLTLQSGDVISTGTPAGVGAGMNPPEFLSPGDVVEAEIDGLGLLRTKISASLGPSLDFMS